MTDLPPPSTPAPSPPLAAASDERQLAFVIYILYLAGFAIPIAPLVGLVLAYVNRETAPDWLKSHYTFQVWTFWIGFFATIISVVLCFLLIGFLLLPALAVWYVVRCAVGLNWLMKNQPYPRPESWIT